MPATPERIEEIRRLLDNQEIYPFTFPCSGNEATELAERLREKLKLGGEWGCVDGIKDGVNLELAVRVIRAYRYNLFCKPLVTGGEQV